MASICEVCGTVKFVTDAGITLRRWDSWHPFAKFAAKVFKLVVTSAIPIDILNALGNRTFSK